MRLAVLIVSIIVSCLALAMSVCAAQSTDPLYPHTQSEKVHDLLRSASLAKPEKSLALYKQAEKIAPRNPDIFYWRAIASESQGQYQRALADIDKALKLAPDYTMARLVRARVLFHLKKFKIALEETERFHSMPGLKRENEHKRIEGACLYHLGRYKEALNPLLNNTSTGEGGKSLEAYYYLGMCQLALDKPEDALKSLNEAIKTRPGDARPAYYLGRARAYEKLGKAKLAARDRAKARTMQDFAWGSF